uniref:Si:ch211-288g17.3 n=1 Tax=Pygocentrus nattereri TaxID=42514 RepID=A0A3B4CA46_PYGNA
MEVEQKDGSDNSRANGNNPAKRGRGRPKGSVKKKIISVTEVTHNARTSKRVDYFSPETVFRPKVKKRGRPKKIRMPGRPRKIPLTPVEEAERMLRLSKQRKRRLSKPLGRPRIHPLVNIPKEKRGRGRPRKYEPIARASSQNGTVNGNLKKNIKRMSELSEAIPRKRGRPQGSFKKKRGLAARSPAKRAIQGTPRKRGRPPGSGTKISVRQESKGTPRKRGRPPGSGTKQKVITQEADGAPRKRGRPSGSVLKIKFAGQETDGIPRKRGRSSNAISASSHPRKRGRPSKASLAEASAVSEVNETSAPKRPRNSFASSEYSGVEAETVADAEDQKASRNDAAEKAAEGVVGGKKHKKK